MITVGPQVRRVRRLRGWTLKELAERTGYSLSYLSDIERGRQHISLACLEKIATALGAVLEITLKV